MLKKLLLLLTVLCVPSVVLADAGLVFDKTVIVIVPAHVIAKAKPSFEQHDALTHDKVDGEASSKNIFRHEIEVEVRPAQIPMNQGFFTHYTLDGKHGLMTYFAATDKRPLVAEQIDTPIDALFLRDDGSIAQIVPQLYLPSLRQTLASISPVRAFLFLQAGLAEKWGVLPGDRIEHGMFTPKPVIQTDEKKE